MTTNKLTPEQRRELLDAINALRDAVEAGLNQAHTSLDTATHRGAAESIRFTSPRS